MESVLAPAEVNKGNFFYPPSNEIFPLNKGNDTEVLVGTNARVGEAASDERGSILVC